MHQKREDGWTERRLLGGIKAARVRVCVSVVTLASGKKGIALTVGNHSEPPRGIVMGDFLARTLRDLLDEAIRSTGTQETAKESADRQRYLAHVIEHGARGRPVGISPREGLSNPCSPA